MEIAGSLTEICGRRCREDMQEVGVLFLDTVAAELADSGKLVLSSAELSVCITNWIRNSDFAILSIIFHKQEIYNV